jgi:hypothetical protein
MKVTITSLKTNGWPDGAKLGDVVELKGDTVPSWAVGKCTPAAPEANVLNAATPETSADSGDAKGRPKR